MYINVHNVLSIQMFTQTDICRLLDVPGVRVYAKRNVVHDTSSPPSSPTLIVNIH